MPDVHCAFINTVAAAEYLGLSLETLEKMRRKGEGPPYHKFGRRVQYRMTDLDAWADNCRVATTPDE